MYYLHTKAFPTATKGCPAIRARNRSDRPRTGLSSNIKMQHISPGTASAYKDMSSPPGQQVSSTSVTALRLCTAPHNQHTRLLHHAMQDEVLLPEQLPHGAGPLVDHTSEAETSRPAFPAVHVKPTIIARTAPVDVSTPQLAATRTLPAAAAPAGPADNFSGEGSHISKRSGAEPADPPASAATAAATAAFDGPTAASPAISSSNNITSSAAGHEQSSRVRPVAADDNVYATPPPAAAAAPGPAPAPAAGLAGSTPPAAGHEHHKRHKLGKKLKALFGGGKSSRSGDPGGHYCQWASGQHA